jgi:hypothetical protein
MMKARARLILAILIAIPFLAPGCSTGRAVKEKQQMAELQTPVVLEKSGKDKRPDWISQKPYSEDEKAFFFTGGYVGGADYALTLRLAKAEATKNLLESVEVKARGEFSSAINGQNRTGHDIGRYVTDAVAWTVENLRVAGIRQNQIYYEQVFDPLSQGLRYNFWVQLGISKADYAKAKVSAAQRLLDKAVKESDEEAKKKAMELLDKLQEEV